MMGRSSSQTTVVLLLALTLPSSVSSFTHQNPTRGRTTSTSTCSSSTRLHYNWASDQESLMSPWGNERPQPVVTTPTDATTTTRRAVGSSSRTRAPASTHQPQPQRRSHSSADLYRPAPMRDQQQQQQQQPPPKKNPYYRPAPVRDVHQEPKRNPYHPSSSAAQPPAPAITRLAGRIRGYRLQFASSRAAAGELVGLMKGISPRHST